MSVNDLRKLPGELTSLVGRRYFMPIISSKTVGAKQHWRPRAAFSIFPFKNKGPKITQLILAGNR
jgi:hypothetical protein